jgi:predicted DNA-binding transcriptional regulator YafY
MRRADRLLPIVQILRRENKPVSADAIIGERVGVGTIYRDMLAMESIDVPVRGEAGVA